MEANDRPVVTCCHCRLRQFLTENRHCRRCHLPLPVPDPDAMRAALSAKPRWVRHDRLAALIGNRLRNLRRGRGMSQEQMAAAMGRPRQYISKIERGIVLPKLRMLQVFAEALDVSCFQILSIVAPKRKPVPPDPFMVELLQLAPAILEADRATIEIAALAMSKGQYTFTDWIAV